MRAGDAATTLSIVAPAHNEQDNVGPLIEEIAAVFRAHGWSYETVLVDDGSTDETAGRALALTETHPELRVIRMQRTPSGRGHGQSAALHAGFRAARGAIIAVLDADLQNDPADIPRLLKVMDETGADLVQGDRSANRQDTFIRRIGSLVGRLTRRWLLGDTIRDTGCSLRLMKRAVAWSLPLQFHGMHRFIPITARQLGYRVVEVPVSHRPRLAGEAKYGRHAIRARALPGLIDCFAVRWIRNRQRPVDAEELTTNTARPRPEAEKSAEKIP